jgi:chromosome segregation ATPase
MTAVGKGFWAGLDKQVAEAAVRETVKPSQPQVLSAPALVREQPEAEPMHLPVAASKWSGVLDIINNARMQAEAQRDELKKKEEAFEQSILEMRGETEALRQQIQVLEAWTQKTKAETDRQVREIQVQAEQRVRDVQAKADSEIAQARSAAQSSEKRAAAAEGWLTRIEEAATNLVPNSAIIAIRRAA